MVTIWSKIKLKKKYEYYNQGKNNSFENILLEVINQSTIESDNNQTKEIIQSYQSLAGYYLELVDKAKTDREREELYGKVDQFLNEVNSRDRLNSQNFAIRGVLYLKKNEIEHAINQFETSLESNNKNINALLGLARIKFNQGLEKEILLKEKLEDEKKSEDEIHKLTESSKDHFRESLSKYEQVLKLNLKTNTNLVRLGMGLCNFKLGNIEKAKMCFERVLKFEENANALASLAIIELNELKKESNKSEKIKTAMDYIQRAYKVDKNNPIVLNQLSNHFYHRQDYKKSEQYAQKAIENTNSEQIKVESNFYIARSYHVQNEYDKAFMYYNQISQTKKDFDFGIFGMSQIYIYKGEYDESIRILKILLKNKNDYDIHKLLGKIFLLKI
jgi:RNA polymerase-associated protein CTR9